MLDLVQVYSHPRSGSNYTRAWIAQVLYPGRDLEREQPVKSGHWAQRQTVAAPPAWDIFGGHNRYSASLTPAIYVVRDVRDVVVSLYYTPEFRHPNRRDMALSDYLRTPLTWANTPAKRVTHGLTPVEHWLAHVNSWASHAGVIILHFEAVLTDSWTEAFALADSMGVMDLDAIREYADRGAAVSLGPQGPWPHDGWPIGRWRDVLSEDDLEYIEGITGGNHWALWNDQKAY